MRARMHRAQGGGGQIKGERVDSTKRQTSFIHLAQPNFWQLLGGGVLSLLRLHSFSAKAP